MLLLCYAVRDLQRARLRQHLPHHNTAGTQLRPLLLLLLLLLLP